MSGFHFSKVPKFKIRCGGIVEDVSLPHLASPTVSGSRPTVLQEPETVVGNPHISPVPEVGADIPSPSNLAGPVPSPGNVRQSTKRKPKVESGEQASRTSRTSMSPPHGRCEYINIGARQDMLDPSVVENLPPAVAFVATSVHKYWTSSFGKAADTAEVAELMKLAEMYTFRSHVLNCELYKMIEMKVDEIHFVLGEDEDVEAMRAEIKRLRARLTFSEDARTRAMYDVTKAQTIHKACVVAQKKAESQLKSCQSIIQAKDKELTEVLNDLTKAKGLLAKLEVPANNQNSTATTSSETAGDGARKRRKRASSSEFYDVTDSSNFAPVAPIAPQGLVPVFPSGTFFMIPPTGGAAAITAAGPSNQPQFWAIPATATPVFNISGRPISNFMSAMQAGMNVSFSSSTTTTSTNSTAVVGGAVAASSDNTESGENSGGKISTTMAPSSSSISSTTTVATGTTSATQMLRNFSLEIYDKKELQFMVGSGSGSIEQTPSSKP
ncbi:TCP domain-containing protein [Forsythia ovata]|uniref:TCP domain-containing protein n=1 Tax=Forsythia ovata TaxID=205694 RepID=A0ABD1WPK7_9LAMI